MLYSTDEQTSILVYDNGKPELLLQIIFCVPLVVCLSEIISSESSSNLIQQACIMFPYLYRILASLVTNLLLKFLLTCLAIIFNTAFGSCGYFNLSIVRSHRQRQFSSMHLRILSLALGLTQFYEQLDESTLNCGEY